MKEKLEHHFSQPHTLYSARSLGILSVVLASVWIIISTLGIRFDVTQEKFFTLSAGSVNLVKKMPDNVSMRLYFSRSIKNLPVPIKAYALRVEDLLRQYVDSSKGKLTLKILDPQPDSDADTWARRYGLKPVPVADGSEFFFGLAVFHGKNEFSIPYIDPRREQLLEYDVSELLQRVITKDRPVVGILSSFDLISKNPYNDVQSVMQGKGDWALVGELKKVATIEKIENDAAAISDRIKILFLHHPKNLSEKTMRAIDQFVLKGGKLIALVDPFSRIDLERQYETGSAGQIENSSDIRTLFSAWDIEFDSSKAVGDLRHPIQINVGGKPLTYPFYIRVDEKGMSKESRVTAQLREIILPEGGSISLRNGSNHSFESLLSTTKSAGQIESRILMSGPAAATQVLKNEDKVFTLGALIRGKFKSAFSTKDSDQNWISESKDESTVIVVADADFIADQNSIQRVPFANQVVVRPVNDNINLILNSIDFLSGSDDLIAIRSRGRFSRPFERLVEIQEKAQAKWKDEEDSIQRKLQETQKKLSEMQGARIEGNKIVLTREQQDEIDRFRGEEAQIRKKLREVRRNLREDIERLGRSLVLLNLTVIPVGLTLMGGLVFRTRANRSRKNKE